MYRKDRNNFQGILRHCRFGRLADSIPPNSDKKERKKCIFRKRFVIKNFTRFLHYCRHDIQGTIKWELKISAVLLNWGHLTSSECKSQLRRESLPTRETFFFSFPFFSFLRSAENLNCLFYEICFKVFQFQNVCMQTALLMQKQYSIMLHKLHTIYQNSNFWIRKKSHTDCDGLN